MSAKQIRTDLKKAANSDKLKTLKSFFKTGPGQYGEGDIFLGVVVPETRKIAKKYKDIHLNEVKELLYSKIHEERLCALLILVDKFEKGTDKEKKTIFDFYIKNIKQVNNWDLVDTSAPKIIGKYLLYKPKNILYKFSVSKNIWERRVAILSTFAFIKNNQYSDTLKISEILLSDKHDLMHKAVGWMLREVGKKDLKTGEDFIVKHLKKMPRTTLRYAIERFPEPKRLRYLKAI